MDFKQNTRNLKKDKEKIGSGGKADAEVSGGFSKNHEQALDQTDASYLLQVVPQLKNSFMIKGKIGEGAFSCVYLARVISSKVNLDNDVALKHLIPTSNPSRMQAELQCLQKLGGRCNVMPILSCIRNDCHVVLVMPHFPHDPFATVVGKMDLCEIREYMKNLLLALKEVHANGIIHRDIKPSNFLYNRNQKRYALCDFGLAQYTSASAPKMANVDERYKVSDGAVAMEIDVDNSNDGATKNESDIMEPKLGPAFFKLLPPASGGSSQVTSNLQLSVFDSKSAAPSGAQSMSEKVCPCHMSPQVCSLCLSRPAQAAPRAGTAGYRPPEVLLKFPFQTTAVDMWSAGIIFLCFLSGHSSFFHANDDLASLTEMITLFGASEMTECARQLGKTLICRPKKPSLSLFLVCKNLRQRSNPISVTDLKGAHNLLELMLTLNPDQRITAERALNHSFFSER